jgi:lysozyme
MIIRFGLANYNDVPSPSPDDSWDFWQFTENGIVHGINTKVDLDIYNGNSWSLKRLTLD